MKIFRVNNYNILQLHQDVTVIVDKDAISLYDYKYES